MKWNTKKSHCFEYIACAGVPLFLLQKVPPHPHQHRTPFTLTGWDRTEERSVVWFWSKTKCVQFFLKDRFPSESPEQSHPQLQTDENNGGSFSLPAWQDPHAKKACFIYCSSWRRVHWLPGVSSRGNLQNQYSFPLRLPAMCSLFSVSVSLL